MADVDIDPFGEHGRTESRTDDDDHTETGENIPFTPVGGGRSSTWEPDRGEQETSFGGASQRTKLMKDYIKDLHKKISENIGETPRRISLRLFQTRRWGTILQRQEKTLNDQRCAEIGWNVGRYIG